MLCSYRDSVFTLHQQRTLHVATVRCVHMSTVRCNYMATIRFVHMATFSMCTHGKSNGVTDSFTCHQKACVQMPAVWMLVFFMLLMRAPRKIGSKPIGLPSKNKVYLLTYLLTYLFIQFYVHFKSISLISRRCKYVGGQKREDSGKKTPDPP